MLKVILVDDEPFNVQGLKVLIDWKKYGFEIVGDFANGKEALDFLKKEKVDLIIADIKMPVMNGMELLQTIREQKISDADFIILSGYSEFHFAQQAIKYECIGYLLKPVDKEELTMLIKKVSEKKVVNTEDEQIKQDMESAYLARNIIALLVGKFDDNNLEYVRNHMNLSEGVRFIDMEFVTDNEEDEEDKQLRHIQRSMYHACRDILKENENHAIFDISRDQDSYDISMIYCDQMAEKKEMSENEYYEWLRDAIETRIGLPVRMYVGKKVNNIENISKSYSTVRIVKSFEGFRTSKDIYCYENEVQVNQVGVVICKNSLDKLISVIEKNEKNEIQPTVNEFYREMKKLGITGETLNLNINYFLFQLIHLATQQDDEVNQEEILRFISESTFSEGVKRGSSEHLTVFANEYADYLSQLRKNVSSGVLQDIEREIHNNFAENLSLRELGKKYFINSSYLGQVFRKKYGQSFKDYLTYYRINEAATLLIKTDKKINLIAEEVGYKDSDYFIRKFIEIKGCTPSKYRKNNLET